MRSVAIRMAVAMAVALITAAMITAAIGFALAAAYLGLLTVLSPPAAALATAGVALVVALFTVGLARIFAMPSKHRDRPASSSGLAASLSGDIGKDLGAWASTHTKEMCAASLAFGLAVGFSPRLRRALFRLMK